MMSPAGRAAIFLRMLAFAVFACVLPACRDRAPDLPRVAAGEVIVAFGDSITFGTGATDRESYPAVLAGLTGRTVVREGVPGEVTAQGLARLPGVIERHQPRLVILCLGGNDMLRKVPERETVENLRAMLRLLAGRRIAVVLVGVPRPALFGGAATFYAELAKEFGVPYEAAVLNDVLRSNALKSDPIHPNAAGYRRIAEALAELLRKAGAV